jgi:glycosidase
MKNPGWLQRAVIYQVFIDRFLQGGSHRLRKGSPPEGKPVFCGGNLQGVAEKLDYLSDLGINTIWLSPFTQTVAYHGYHVTDFFRVEKRFGGQNGLQTLVKTARAHGIRLIMDFVPNHVHVTHPWFQEAKRNKRSPYRHWFYWQRNGDYLKFFGVDEMPKLNLDHPEARKEIIRAAKHWMDQGIDGFRLDFALGPSLDFWREFRDQLKRHDKEVALIAEVYFWRIQRQFLPTINLPDKSFYFLAQQLGLDAMSAAMKEYAEVFDGLLDFTFQKLLRVFVANNKRKMSSAQIQEMLDQHYAGFPDDCSLVSFLDNHDMNRFLFEARGDKARLKRAMEIQFAQRCPPVIYYGTELGMSQTAPVRGNYGDLQARRMMTWQSRDRSIFNLYKRLIQKRTTLYASTE